MPTPMHPIITPVEAKGRPYPYVHVNADGSVRELSADERKYLETPFSPFDGGQPYVKSSYEQTDGRKSIAGFCRRSLIPAGMDIRPADDSITR